MDRKIKLIAKTYGALSDTARQKVKQLFLKQAKLDLSDKTLQRWFNYPTRAPQEHIPIMLQCINNIIETERAVNDYHIALLRKKYNRSLSQRRTFQEFLNNYITFNN